ncbi:ABC transporter ATPase [Flavicella sediminum]|uniref:ABC transporter ATPase n=1 Tax=Flavicella sediminum TaxID=2585141 RepID=UPI001124C5F5|nr:ABC transporter ATPase [Flavicella sediminum]
MLVDYNSLPDSSRVWVYQADRSFSEEEIKEIEIQAGEFINAWTRHGDDLKGGFTIKYKQFIILAVDESFAQASGCSIDSSVRFVKSVEDALSVDLMNKLNVTFKDGATINLVSLSDFQNFAKEGKITADTIVFNNMVQTKKEVETKWEVPASESWHARFV